MCVALLGALARTGEAQSGCDLASYPNGDMSGNIDEGATYYPLTCMPGYVADSMYDVTCAAGVLSGPDCVMDGTGSGMVSECALTPVDR